MIVCRLHLSIAFVFILAACAGDAASGPSSSDGGLSGTDASDADTLADRAQSAPATAVVTRFAGIYFVPDRTEVSTYPIDEATWTVSNGRARLEYNLPRLLVGQSERVRLEGPLDADGTASLAGPMGTGECQLAPSTSVRLSCVERFTNITVDLAGVREEASREDPARSAARIDVATRFSTDPIGVFEATDIQFVAEAVPTCVADTDCGVGRCDFEPNDGFGVCEIEAQAKAGDSSSRDRGRGRD